MNSFKGLNSRWLASKFSARKLSCPPLVEPSSLLHLSRTVISFFPIRHGFSTTMPLSALSNCCPSHICCHMNFTSVYTIFLDAFFLCSRLRIPYLLCDSLCNHSFREPWPFSTSSIAEIFCYCLSSSAQVERSLPQPGSSYWAELR